MENILVIIAARGGSKGVKNKNIRPLSGVPLIGHTIKQALAWGKASQVVVSTDSKEIADVAKACGASVPFIRQQQLAEDNTPKGIVIKDALIKSEEYFNQEFDVVVDLDATAPIRTTDDLNNCLEIYRKERPKTLFSVVHAHKNPYFNMVERQKDGKIVISKELPGGVSRRQDAPEVYAMNASIYFYCREYLINSELTAPITDDSAIYLMDELAGVDIDREIDFKYIEFLLDQQVVKL